MALKRLQRDEAYRIILASPFAFADPEAPTAAELNANSTNAPDGRIFHLTCAFDTSSTTFDLDDPELDESLTFCQKAGDSEVMSRSATVVLGLNMSADRWDDATSVLAAGGYNTATLAQSLLSWRGVTYYAIMSIGKAADEVFAVGDRIKMAEIATDNIEVSAGTGENVILTQTPAKRSFLNWNYEIAA